MKVFVVCKFRSLSVDAERRTGAVWASDDNPHVTPIGRVPRQMHLDEMPQTLNLLIGERSLQRSCINPLHSNYSRAPVSLPPGRRSDQDASVGR